MTDTIRVAVESRKKGEKSAAYAIVLPGWNRGGKTPGEAYANWSEYQDRYRSVAGRAGRVDEFDAHVEAQRETGREKQNGRGFWQGKRGWSSWNGLPRGPTSDVKTHDSQNRIS